jgi:HK97 family phage portal protein
MKTGTHILDKFGRPFAPIEDEKKAAALTKSFSPVSSFLSSLVSLSAPSLARARDPMANHAWVFAAAMIRATNISQAPLTLFRETEETEKSRQEASLKRLGRWDGPQSGRRRAAVQRHLTRAANPARFRGERMKKLEPMPEHPLSAVLDRPNPFMTKSQLVQLLELWLCLRGEAFWVFFDENGERLLTDTTPIGEIWPANPDRFEEVFEPGGGRQLGWFYRTEENDPMGHRGQRIPLEMHEVAHFKYPNPVNPFRGLSPIAAAASSINLDLMAKEMNRAIMANGSDPGGVLTYEGEMLDPQEEEAVRSRWENRHKGPTNVSKVGILWGSWKYLKTGLSPADLQHLETLKWDRDEIFAVLRVPKTTAGVTESVNYATQLGQDKNLWDKGLLPDVRLIEDTIDTSVLGNVQDNVTIAFDLSNIEALKQGLAEQIDAAKKLMAVDAHMPPVLAFEMVGLEVPEYPGSDTCFVAPLNVSVEKLLEDEEAAEEEPEVAPSETPPNVDDEEEEDEEEPEEEEKPKEEDEDEDEEAKKLMRGAVNLLLPRRKLSKANQWKRFLAVQTTIEKGMKLSWRDWVEGERKLQLKRIQEVLGKRAKASVAEIAANILIPLPEMTSRIKGKFQPKYSSALEATYNLTTEELGGIVTFEIDDPRIIDKMTRRLTALSTSAPKTLQKRLKKQLVEGIKAAETIGQIRERVAHVFNVAVSTPKTLAIARTESASFMNSVREGMFEATGVEELEWVTAGDEHVRESHKVFGGMAPQKMGYNYLSALGRSGEGELKFPGDPDAPIGEVANCRCVRIIPV